MIKHSGNVVQKYFFKKIGSFNTFFNATKIFYHALKYFVEPH